jgi:CBS domain containing-hemolysin-like protein
VEGLAVVNDAGEMMGALHLSDATNVTLSNLKVLEQPILTFLQTFSAGGPIIAGLETTLPSILQRMKVFKSHNVWIIGADSRPAGIVTMTDICEILSQ